MMLLSFRFWSIPVRKQHLLTRLGFAVLFSFGIHLVPGNGIAGAQDLQFSQDGVLWHVERDNIRLSQPTDDLALQSTFFLAGLGIAPQLPMHFYRLPILKLDTADEADRAAIHDFLNGISKAHVIGRVDLLNLAVSESELSDVLSDIKINRSWDIAWQGAVEARLFGEDIDTEKVYSAIVRKLVEEDVIDAAAIDGSEERLFMVMGTDLPLEGMEALRIGDALLVEATR
ncbi:MAG: hypothetical protein ACXIVD_14550 [Salinarimonas sp.]